MILLTEYFKPKSARRFSEYLYTLHENIENKFIDKIILFVSDNARLNFESNKIQIIALDQRPTFQYMIDYCNQNFDDICILGNSDIIFDDSLSLITKQHLKNTAYGISRRELQDDYSIKERPYQHLHTSQDAWIFLPKLILNPSANFTFGTKGCDLRISSIIKESGYDIKNPYGKIILKHFHLTEYRTYNDNALISGRYHTLPPWNDL